MNAMEYAVVEHLRDGRPLLIRALRPADRPAMIEFAGQMSEETRYRRFFAPKRTFSEREIEYFLNVDFVNHVALVAELEGEGKRQVIVGGGRYVVTAPGRAELALTIDDGHQQLGIGTRVMRHLIDIARSAQIGELVAEVLPDNAPMLKVFQRCGLAMTTRHEPGVVQVTLDLKGHPT